MTTIPVSLRRFVIQRANNRCECCGISQVGQVATFHIDHIIPSVAGGETKEENLALGWVVFLVLFVKGHDKILRIGKLEKLFQFLILVNNAGWNILFGMVFELLG